MTIQTLTLPAKLINNANKLLATNKQSTNTLYQRKTQQARYKKVNCPTNTSPTSCFTDGSPINTSPTNTSPTEVKNSPDEKAVSDILTTFNSHSLADLNHANLMDRVDVKFMLPTTFLPILLTQVKHHYSILDINGKRIASYFNQYFDTANLSLYNAHHNGKLNRYKVRHRTYLDTDTGFLEVKLKNNRKRTIKSRIHCPELSHNDEQCQEFIHRKMAIAWQELQLSQQGGYQRIALANEASAERLTLDFNLWYQQKNNSEKLTLPGFFIAELKQHKRSKLSPFFQLMSANGIFPVSFSKYCIGLLLNQPEIKHNLFNPQLKMLRRLMGEPNVVC